MNDNFKKSYLGLIVWLIVYMALMAGVGFLPFEARLMIRVFMVFTAFALFVLMAMMYLMDRAYWMNGVTYEQALEAGIERRKRYVFQHLRLFLIYAIAYAIYSVIAFACDVPWAIDIIVFALSTIVVAIYTNKYRL